MPQMRGPQLRGPQLGSVNAGSMARGKIGTPNLSNLRPGAGQSVQTGPLLPTQGLFRQRPWLPWWLVPLLALLLVLLFLLYKFVLPHNVVVPDVVGKKSAFEAEETLTKSKLILDPNQKTKVDDKVAPGTVVSQTPKKGTEAEKGAKVTILLAVGSGKVKVPSIVGQTATDADASLRKAELTLGQSAPPNAKQEDKIASQIPAEGQIVQKGTAINIFFPDPASEEAKKKAAEEAKKKAEANGGKDGGGGGGGAGGAAGQIRVPAIEGQDTKTYAKTLADLGIVPVTKNAFSDAPVGKPFDTKPVPGSPVKAKQKVTVLISIGQPDVVYSNGKNILRINGANGSKLPAVADTDAEEKDPTWNPVGTHVAYTADGQLMLKDVTKDNTRPVPLRPASEHYGDLAWAPNPEANVIAMRSDPLNSDDNDLCFAEVRRDATDISCKAEPSFAPTRAMHWSQDGRTILSVGVPLPRSGKFGIVRWTLKQGKQPFSPNEADWNKGKFVSDIDTAGKGVLDAAFSPDGKQIALVSNIGSSSFRLWLAENTGKADDFLLTTAKATPTRACKVSWRSDSQVVIVVQGDALCGEEVSSLARVDVGSVRDERGLSAVGDDPSFRPPAAAGG
jgi:beta-lactam-binding protein with PASTA domain